MHRRHRRRWIVKAICLGAVIAIIIGGVLLSRAGYRVYVVHTGSMMPTLMPGDAVIDVPAPRRVHTGEIVTFRHSNGPDVVTHRVIKVLPNGAFHTKGDANKSADAWTIPPNMVEGRVAVIAPYLGYLLVYLKQPTGVASLGLICLTVILLWGLCFPLGESRSTAPLLLLRTSGGDALGGQRP